MSVISSIKIHECSYPLVKPYQLSFVTLTEFKTIRVTLTLSKNECRLAEVVPLEGYSDESYGNVLKTLKESVIGLNGLRLTEARLKVLKELKGQPFSSTAILTSIDLFNYQLINRDEADKLPTLKPFSTSQLLNNEIKKDWFENGQTYKLKLSGDLLEDEEALNWLNFISDVNCSIRVDANQAYEFNKAYSLLIAFQKTAIRSNVEYFEQLLDQNDWEGQSKLVAAFPEIEFMLDEPIVGHSAIDRAKAIGVKYVKLKLYKQGGIVELLSHAEYAHRQGLNVILGNGVATWASNQIELSVYASNRSWFSGVHEANGYLKMA